MNHLTFIWTAYVLTLLASSGLLAYRLCSMHAAQHDEKYMPPELSGKTNKPKAVKS